MEMSEKPPTPHSQKKSNSLSSVGVFKIKNAPVESERDQSVSPDLTPHKIQSSRPKIEDDDNRMIRIHKTPDELNRQDSSEVEYDSHTPREMQIPHYPERKADVKKKGRFTIKQGESRKSQQKILKQQTTISSSSIKKFEPLERESLETNFTPDPLDQKIIPEPVLEEDQYSDSNRSPLPSERPQKMGRFKVHNLRNNGHKTPTAIITSEGAASQDYFRANEHRELKEEKHEEIKMPEQREKPKKKGTKNKVFTGEVDLEVQVSPCIIQEGESTDFIPKTVAPRKLPPPIISKFQEQEYASDNVHLRKRAQGHVRTGSLLKSEHPPNNLVISQFGKLGYEVSTNQQYSSLTSNLQTEHQGEHVLPHTVQNLPVYQQPAYEYHSPQWRAAQTNRGSNYHIEERNRQKTDKTLDDSRHQHFLFSPKLHKHHSHHHHSLPFRSVHESLIYNARPFDHESTETDSMDEHYHVNLHIARNMEENTQALKTMVMDQFMMVVRSHENMVLNMLQHYSPVAQMTVRTNQMLTSQQEELAQLKERINLLEAENRLLRGQMS